MTYRYASIYTTLITKIYQTEQLTKNIQKFQLSAQQLKIKVEEGNTNFINFINVTIHVIYIYIYIYISLKSTCNFISHLINIIMYILSVFDIFPSYTIIYIKITQLRVKI